MKRRTQQFVAAFAIAAMIIAAMCGFVVVDLSTQRYMPSDSAPLFLMTGINAEGVTFSALGLDYKIAVDQFEQAGETIWRYRGMLPVSATFTGSITTRGYFALIEYLDSLKPVQEPW